MGEAKFNPVSSFYWNGVLGDHIDLALVRKRVV